MIDPIKSALDDIKRLLDIADVGLGLDQLLKNADTYGVELDDNERKDEFSVSSRLSDYKDSRIDTIIDNLARQLKTDFDSTASLVRKMLGL